jgi:hypothetical protein
MNGISHGQLAALIVVIATGFLTVVVPPRISNGAGFGRFTKALVALALVVFFALPKLYASQDDAATAEQVVIKVRPDSREPHLMRSFEVHYNGKEYVPAKTPLPDAHGWQTMELKTDFVEKPPTPKKE